MRAMMNRRNFSRNIAGAALGASALTRGSALEQNAQPAAHDSGVPFQLSVMLWALGRKHSFGQRLEQCAQAGYKNAQLTGEYKSWSDDEFDRYLNKAKELGIRFDLTSGLKHSLGNPADRDALLEDLRNELPLMERLNCPALIVMSGNLVPGMPRAVQHQSCIDGLKRAAAVIEGKQIAGLPVRILLENIDPEENPRYYLQSVAEGFEIMKAVNHPQVQFLYDFFHEQIAEGNLIEKLEKNIQYTGVVHIADVPGRHRPGTGEINYENIFRKLGELKFSHVAAMEFLPAGDPVEELRGAREMALRCGRV